MKLAKRTRIIIVIFLIAISLRFYQIGTNPPSLTWDEVAWGYNAYSLGIDGRDEFGVLLPYKYLESFGDFKPPVYAYLDIIPVKLFGLNEFATRFPSAFFGALTVLLTYFLTKRIFYKSPRAELYSMIAMLFLAFSPWHINLSRAAFEANIVTFLLTTGVYLFLMAIQSRKWLLLFSVGSFVLCFYTFNTGRIVAPLLGSALAILYWKKLWSIKKQSVLAGIIALFLLLPLIGFLLSPQAKLRYKEVNIFSDISLVQTTNQEVANDNGAKWSKLIHNRRVIYAQAYLKHYFDHFDPKFLFISGDVNTKFSTHDVGQMYLWDVLFLVPGIFLLFRKREGNWWVIPIWLLIGIIPAATARETPHALRIEATLPTFQILSAYGFASFLLWIEKQKKHIAAYRNLGLAVFLLLFITILYYLHGYYSHYAKQNSVDWQYGYKEALAYTQSVEHNYNEVDFTDKLGRPYIYYLFYTKTQPTDFRANATVTRDNFGFVNVPKVGKYVFSDNNVKTIGKKVLRIGTVAEVPGDAHILKKFKQLDGSVALVAYEE